MAWKLLPTNNGAWPKHISDLNCVVLVNMWTFRGIAGTGNKSDFYQKQPQPTVWFQRFLHFFFFFFFLPGQVLIHFGKVSNVISVFKYGSFNIFPC